MNTKIPDPVIPAVFYGRRQRGPRMTMPTDPEERAGMKLPETRSFPSVDSCRSQAVSEVAALSTGGFWIGPVQAVGAGSVEKAAVTRELRHQDLERNVAVEGDGLPDTVFDRLIALVR